MGLLNNLAFFIEGFFHIVRFRYGEEDKTAGMNKPSRKMINNEEERQDIAEPILFQDELNLKLAAKETAERLIETPSFYYKLLLMILTLA